MTGKVFPKEPMSKGTISRLFFEAARNGLDEIVRDMLKKDKYLVYEFDHVGETPLHWAAKRNRVEVVKLLISYGSKVNARDMGGRTALFLACKSNHL